MNTGSGKKSKKKRDREKVNSFRWFEESEFNITTNISQAHHIVGCEYGDSNV